MKLGKKNVLLEHKKCERLSVSIAKLQKREALLLQEHQETEQVSVDSHQTLLDDYSSYQHIMDTKESRLSVEKVRPQF